MGILYRGRKGGVLTMVKKKVVNIAEVVGQGYGKVWKDKDHRY